jgi:hypothetical protein
MSDCFIGKKMNQVYIDSDKQIISFKAGSHLFKVKKILRQWQDYDYSPLAPRRDWRSRHHRNYYRILTESGQCFELYCDRGTRLESSKEWILVREILNHKIKRI